MVVFLRLAVFAVVCLCATPSAWARYQSGIDVFDTAHGLPIGEVVSVVQDRHGYVWVATLGSGVYRFDGERFVRFGDVDGISQRRVFRLHVDRSGVVRACTNAGIVAYIEGRFAREPRFATVDDHLVRDLLEARDGSFWAATDQGAYHFSGGTVEHFDVAEGLPRRTVLALAQDKIDAIWLGTDRGLARLRDGQMMVWRAGDAGLANDYVTRLLPETDRSMWVATDLGLYRFANETFTKVDLRTRASDVYVLDSGEEVQAGFRGGGLCEWRGHVAGRASWLDDTCVRTATFR